MWWTRDKTYDRYNDYAQERSQLTYQSPEHLQDCEDILEVKDTKGNPAGREKPPGETVARQE